MRELLEQPIELRQKEHIINFKSVVVPEDEIEEERTIGTFEMSPFCTSLSLDELAKLQGIDIAQEPDVISSLWPADEDPDEMLNHIICERAYRRQITMGERD